MPKVKSNSYDSHTKYNKVIKFCNNNNLNDNESKNSRNSAQWNSLLLNARRLRGPQWDNNTQM